MQLVNGRLLTCGVACTVRSGSCRHERARIALQSEVSTVPSSSQKLQALICAQITLCQPHEAVAVCDLTVAASLLIMIFKKFTSSDVSSSGPVKSSVVRGVRGVHIAPAALVEFQNEQGQQLTGVMAACSQLMRALPIPGRNRAGRPFSTQERSSNHRQMVCAPAHRASYRSGRSMLLSGPSQLAW